jgi:hypothetical protein
MTKKREGGKGRKGRDLGFESVIVQQTVHRRDTELVNSLRGSESKQVRN